MPGFVLVVFKELLEPEYQYYDNLSWLRIMVGYLGHQESTSLRILSGPSWATLSNSPTISSRRGRSSSTRGPVITFEGSTDRCLSCRCHKDPKRSKPVLGGHRKASIGSVCESIPTSSFRVATFLSGQTCDQECFRRTLITRTNLWTMLTEP